MHPHAFTHQRAHRPRHSMSARAPVSSGFTLIEILIVITITAIISFSAVGGIINLQRSARVNEMHSRFINFLDLARNYALNGKQVTCPNKSICVPAYFGAAIIDNKDSKKCPDAQQRAFLFFGTASDFSSGDPGNNTLDSYCINPKVYFKNGTNGGNASDSGVFAYTTPFGEFRAQGVDAKISSGTPLTLNFCDISGTDTKCGAQALQKSITLYSHVGVPE